MNKSNINELSAETRAETMPRIINDHKWVLPTEIIQAASLEATKQKLLFVYLSDGAKKGDVDFLFFKDEDKKQVAFVIDKRDLYGQI